MYSTIKIIFMMYDIYIYIYILIMHMYVYCSYIESCYFNFKHCYFNSFKNYLNLKKHI